MGDLPPVQWLRSFEAAAKHSSFTRAAKELHITQSAVSQQVKLLEHALGMALFIRQPRGLVLTEAGHLYLQTVQSAFETLRYGTQLLASGDKRIRLELRSNWAFSVYWLIPRLPQFLALYPEIELNLSTELWSSGHTSVKSGTEVRFGKGDWPADQIVQLTQEAAYPVCSPEFAQRIKTPKDLLQLPLIISRGMQEQWSDWFRAAQISGKHKGRTHSTSTFIIGFEMAKQHLGAVLGHDLLCRSLLESGQLVKPMEVTIPLSENYYLLTYGPPNHAVQVFQAWLLESMQRFSAQSGGV